MWKLPLPIVILPSAGDFIATCCFPPRSAQLLTWTFSPTHAMLQARYATSVLAQHRQIPLVIRLTRLTHSSPIEQARSQGGVRQKVAAVRKLESRPRHPDPYDPQRKVVELASGGSVHYTLEQPAAPRAGAPLVVAVHGAPGSTFDFRYVGPAIVHTAHLPVLRLDLPGHGASSRPADPSGRGMAHAVLSAVQAIGTQREPGVAAAKGVILIGHSLGGELVCHMGAELLRHRQSTGSSGTASSSAGKAKALPALQGLVLINPVGLRPHKALRPWWIAKASSKPLDWPRPFGGWWKAALHKMWVKVFRFPPRTTADEVEWGQRRVSARRFDQLHDDVAAIAAAGVPSAVIYAEDDHLVEPAVPEELGAALGACHIVRCSNGGHYLNKAQACEVADLVSLLVQEGDAAARAAAIGGGAGAEAHSGAAASEAKLA